MTKREAAIVATYTGILLGNFEGMHKYIEEIVGRPVFTHELGSKEFVAKLKQLSKQDFISLVVE